MRVQQIHRGRTYPVEWRLRDANGALVSDLGAITSITFKSTSCTNLTSDPTDALETTSTGGTTLTYDQKDNQYVYPFDTPSKGC